jgi:hypothetical protein
MFVLAYGGKADGKQVGFLKAAVTDLMGYNGILGKACDRNVAASGNMVALAFGQLGSLSKQKAKLFTALWEVIAPLKYAAWSGPVPQTWNLLSKMADGDLRLSSWQTK